MSKPGKALLIGLLFLLACAGTAAAETTASIATLVPPGVLNPTPTPGPVINRDYELGTRGDDVYAFKVRLQYLGYFRKSAELSNKISEKTMEYVNQLLADNGMEPVETITTELQTMIFEDDDLAIVATPTPSPAPEPALSPQGTPALPAHDADGFLEEADGEYVFADDEDGLWYYLSDDLYINIRRYNDQQEDNVWLEAEVKMRGDQQLLSFFTNTLHTYRTPVTIARENSAVLAFTDDYFIKRGYGIVIRNGVIYRDKLRKSSTSFPIGDTLAVFADGSMCAYAYNAYSADEYLEMGAVDVLSFGPWLLHEGEINPKLLERGYMPYHEPRCALGMIEPGHYVILVADGRYDGADGMLFTQLASRMQEVGVTEALNLDGGGTAALVFMGNQLSRVSNTKADGSNARKVSTMLGFGTSDAVPE